MTDALDYKEGPLTLAELQGLWVGAVDPTYSQGLIDAGEGNGFEAYTQFFAQLARVSRAIDTTTQAMYLRPWSGMTGNPAQGDQKATVTLSVARGGDFAVPLVLYAGQVLVEEETTDWGENGGEAVLTGRRYRLTQTLVFHPGDAGPYDVPAEAELAGWGHNNPLPGTLRSLPQPGAGLTNNFATVTLIAPALAEVPAAAKGPEVNAANEADTFVPELVGQYLQFTGGANNGLVGRVTTYFGPDVAADSGGRVRLADTYSFQSSTVVGTFTAGERVRFITGGVTVGYAVLLGARSAGGVLKVTLDVLSGVPGTSIAGLSSAATATVDFVAFAQTFAAEVAAATWRVLDWVLDWKVTSTNAASPSGGRLGFLDELGRERGVYRAGGESDDSYRARVIDIGDTVSPNAIRRTINRILVPHGLVGCFREVGQPEYRGLFYDAGGSAAGDDTHPPVAVPNPDHNFGYDMDFTTRPSDRYKLYLDLAEFRGYFFVGVPRLSVGEFGFPYDTATGDPFPVANAYDLPVGATFYDGYPWIAAGFWRALYQAVQSVKAAGVGFELYIEDGSCP